MIARRNRNQVYICCSYLILFPILFQILSFQLIQRCVHFEDKSQPCGKSHQVTVNDEITQPPSGGHLPTICTCGYLYSADSPQELNSSYANRIWSAVTAMIVDVMEKYIVYAFVAQFMFCILLFYKQIPPRHRSPFPSNNR